MRNILRWVGAIFAGIGTILLLTAIVLLYRDSGFAGAATATQGTVIQLVRQVSRDHDRRSSRSVTYTAVVVFADRTGQRHEFAERLSSNPPRFSTGQEVRVLYDPAHPANAVVDDFWGRKGIAVIVAGVATPVTIIGVALFLVDIRRSRRRTRLLRRGRPIEAEFLHVFRDGRMSRNGEHPYRVVAQARDSTTGKVRRYESDPVWVDPTESLKGRSVRVLVDPSNQGRYHVDLSAIVGDN